MTHISGIWVGWKDTECASDICEIVDSDPDLFSPFTHVLLSRLDSIRRVTLDLPSLRGIRKTKVPEMKEVTGGVVFPTSKLAELARDEHLFNGFDQIWLLTRYTDAEIETAPSLDIQRLLALPESAERSLELETSGMLSGCDAITPPLESLTESA